MEKAQKNTVKGEETDRAIAAAGSASPDLNEDSLGLHDSIVAEKDEIKAAEERMRRNRDEKKQNKK